MLTGVVLAGGMSRRMGRDKAHLMRFQQSMLAFTAEQLLLSGVDEVVISGPDSLPETPFQVIPDGEPQLGPLGGISTILEHSYPKSDHLLFVPVDLPLLDHQQLITLKSEGIARDKVVMYRGQPLPLFVPTRTEVRSALRQQIEDGSNLSIRRFADVCGGDIVVSSATDCWFNSNTPEDWRKALDLLNNR